MSDRKSQPSTAAQASVGARISLSLLLLFGVLAIVLLGVFIGQTGAVNQHVVQYAAVATFLFGVSVGLSEILSHYRDEPMAAAATAFGMAYLLLNGLLALAAFAVLRKYPTQIFPAVKDDYFLTAVFAGFGAMAIFRSKLFTYRTDDGKDIAIGPSIVLETIFKTIDAKIDRRRATARQVRIFEQLHDVRDFSGMANYIEASLFSFQNLSQDDKTQIKTILDQYRGMTAWPDTLKCMGVGFAFLNIAGDENFDQVVNNLKRFIAEQKTPLASNPQNPPPAV
jgi:hypothetical protein